MIFALFLQLLMNFSHAAPGKCWQRPGHYIVAAENVVYQKGPEAQTLDIYFPSNASPPYKTVISFHGGCFQWGSKNSEEDLEQIQRFTSAGYAVVSVDYRLADPLNPNPLKRNLFPAALEDAQDAVRWVRANGANYKLQTERLMAFGYSAGATLAAYLGTRPVLGSEWRTDVHPLDDSELSKRVAGVIDFFGRTDFTHGRPVEVHAQDGRDCGEEFVGENRGATAEQNFVKANVLSQVDGNATPFLIVHGTADTAVSIEHSELLLKKLRDSSALPGAERERRFQLLKIEGAEHMLTKKEEMDAAWSKVCPYLTEVLGAPATVKTVRAVQIKSSN